MELIEKLQKIIEREIDNVPMVLTDPLTLRRLLAERLAQAALTGLVQALDKHGLKVVSADYLDKVAKLEEFVRSVIRYAGNNGDDYLADKARAALKGSQQ